MQRDPLLKLQRACGVAIVLSILFTPTAAMAVDTSGASVEVRSGAVQACREALKSALPADTQGAALAAAIVAVDDSEALQTKRLDLLYADAASERVAADSSGYPAALGEYAATYALQRVAAASGHEGGKAVATSDIARDIVAEAAKLDAAASGADSLREKRSPRPSILAAQSIGAPAGLAAGDVTINNGLLMISVRQDGAIALWRKDTAGSWIPQIYGVYSKGTRLGIGAESWGTPSGTFNMATQNVLVVTENIALGNYAIKTVFAAPGTSARLTQTVKTSPYSDYVEYQWSVVGAAGGSRSYSLIHGQDTWFNNYDNGEGHYDESARTLAVTSIGNGNVTGSTGSRGHVGLRAETVPDDYIEGPYHVVQMNAQNGVLGKTVDMTYHDAAYAFRWSRSLSAGAVWTVRASEKVNYGPSDYAVPVVLVTGYDSKAEYSSPSESGGGLGEWFNVLKRHGRIVVAAPAVDSYTSDYKIAKKGDLYNNAWRLEQFLNNAGSGSPLLSDYNNRRFERVDAVGYSMGGLILRGYGQRAVDSAGLTSLRRVVTLGSPHAGSQWYSMFGMSEASSQMSLFWKTQKFNKDTKSGLRNSSTPLLVGSRGSSFGDGLVYWDSASYLPAGTWYALPVQPSVAHSSGLLQTFFSVDDPFSSPIGTARWINKRDWTLWGGWAQSHTAESEIVPYLMSGTKPSWAETRSRSY